MRTLSAALSCCRLSHARHAQGSHSFGSTQHPGKASRLRRGAGQRSQIPSTVPWSRRAALAAWIGTCLDPVESSRLKLGALRYDRVLADVPCSGDGTLRRRPHCWESWSIEPWPSESRGVYRALAWPCFFFFFAQEFPMSVHSKQLQILCRGLHLLRPGGRLVYSTCSMNPLENEAGTWDSPLPGRRWAWGLRLWRLAPSHSCRPWWLLHWRALGTTWPCCLWMAFVSKLRVAWKAGGCPTPKAQAMRTRFMGASLCGAHVGLAGVYYKSWAEVPTSARKPTGQLTESMFPCIDGLDRCIRLRLGLRCMKMVECP